MDGWTDRWIMDKQAGRWTKEQRDKWLDTLMDGMVMKTYLYTSLSGILSGNGTIDNEKSIKRLAEVAVAYAKAGKNLILSNFFLITKSINWFDS